MNERECVHNNYIILYYIILYYIILYVNDNGNQINVLI